MKMSVYLAVSLIIVSALLGAVTGYALTPEYQSAMYVRDTMDLGPADRQFDRRYIDAMAAHHRGAMLLAEQAQRNGQREEIKKLAADILAGEPKLIDELYSWKQSWYNDGRRARDPQVAQLGPADDTFDLRFLNALIAHHEAGIDMTQETRLKSSRSEVLNNADAVEQFLSGGVEMLSGWRSQWYSI